MACNWRQTYKKLHKAPKNIEEKQYSLKKKTALTGATVICRLLLDLNIAAMQEPC
jgi:hypothetical protein